MAHAHHQTALAQGFGHEIRGALLDRPLPGPSPARPDPRRHAADHTSEPIAAASAEAGGASVEVTTRAVKVLALKL